MGDLMNLFGFPQWKTRSSHFVWRAKATGWYLNLLQSVFHYHDRTLSEYLQRKFGIGYWKAFMLHWIPEKTFSDSHTAPTQRAEILLMAMLMATIPFFIFWPFYASIFFLIVLVVFLATISPFLIFIRKRDPQVLWIAPGMVFGRAGALGMGLLKGFILPPKVGSKGFPCLSMRVRLIKRMIDIAGSLHWLIPICTGDRMRSDRHPVG